MELDSRRPRTRILHCIPTLEGGGAERQLALLAAEQVRVGYEVDVAVVRRGVHCSRLLEGGATVHGLADRGAHPLFVARRIQSLVRALRPDVVQTWLPMMDILGGWAACQQRVPWVLSERSSEQAYPPGIVTTTRAILARAASAVVANSESGRTYWSRRVDVPGWVAPNALPLGEIDAAPQADIRSGRPLVLFVGRLSPEKDPLLFVEAMKRVVSVVPAHAMICGRGPLQAEVERVRQANVAAGYLSLAGYRDDVWSLMKAAGAFVSTSVFEGRPAAVIEAMAARCPVVLSDIPAHREIADEQSARYFPPNDPSAAATAIAETLSGGPAVAERIRRARATAEGWTLQRLASRYDQVYRSVAGRIPRKTSLGRIFGVLH